MPPHPSAFTTEADVLLTALGKTWGKLIDGRFLEMRRGDLTVRFDLCATAIHGRPVLAMDTPEDHCNLRPSVLNSG
jgi:hypothetical protein